MVTTVRRSIFVLVRLLYTCVSEFRENSAKVCAHKECTNLGSQTMAITHFLWGPTLDHVFASSTIPLALRRPYPYEWLTAGREKNRMACPFSKLHPYREEQENANKLLFFRAFCICTFIRGISTAFKNGKRNLKGAVPLRPTPLVLQSLVRRWLGCEVRTTRCCMSLQVRFLLEQKVIAVEWGKAQGHKNRLDRDRNTW